MTSSRTDVQKGQYATFLRQKSKSKMSVLQINVIQRRGVISHDLQTGFLVLKAKELPASRCSQVREKKKIKMEHHKEEMGKGHMFCQSKIIIDQGTQAYKKNPNQNKKTV